jgi:hypothetical protein
VQPCLFEDPFVTTGLYPYWSVAYERAVTHSKGIFQQRTTTPLVLEL